MNREPFTPTNTDPWVFKGGLNLEAASLALQPGMAIDAMNYEPEVGQGYRRMLGYERFDGRPSPSAQSYWILPLTISGEIAVGNTVTGDTSTATGVVLQVNAAELVLSKVVGTFQAVEDITVGAVVQGTTTGTAAAGGAADPLSDALYKNLAADLYRADIAAVPGSGPVRGVWRYKGVTYAFRNNAGGTACVMHKSTASGWSAITFGEELAFTAGTATFTEGGTVTQGGVSATVARIVVQSGTFGAGTAAGRLIITGRTGGDFAAGAIAGSGAAAATGSGIQTAIVLDPSGRFEFVTNNFTGSSDTRRMYGCDGVNRAFEFDGTTFVPISTGMAADTPTHIAVHKKHLFLSFRGSLQHSSIGNPYQWSVVTGAAELGLGDDVTSILSVSGEATGGASLIATSKSSAHILYGSSSSDWSLVRLSGCQGAYPYTTQEIGGVRYMSTFGITSVAATANYGNFQYSTVSRAVQKLVNGKAGMSVASALWRKRNQYRVFFSDGVGLIVSFDLKSTSIMPFTYANAPTCVCSELDEDQTEKIFFGSSNGMVYEAEKGTSYDGAEIDFWLRLPFWHSKGPSVRKHWRRVFLTTRSEGYSTVKVGREIDFGSPNVGISTPGDSPALTRGGYWDSPDSVWDEIYWDGRPAIPFVIDTPGDGTTISLLFYGKSDYLQPHTLESAVLHYSPRRLERMA